MKSSYLIKLNTTLYVKSYQLNPIESEYQINFRTDPEPSPEPKPQETPDYPCQTELCLSLDYTQGACCS